MSDPIALDALTLHHFNFVLFEFSATRLAMWNTFLLGLATATIGTGLALVVAYLASRNAVARRAHARRARHSARCDPRNRARRRAVPQLLATAH